MSEDGDDKNNKKGSGKNNAPPPGPPPPGPMGALPASSESPAGNDASKIHEDLLAEIRGGTKLRKVQKGSGPLEPRAEQKTKQVPLQQALSRALRKRRKAIQGKNEDEEDEDWDDDKHKATTIKGGLNAFVQVPDAPENPSPEASAQMQAASSPSMQQGEGTPPTSQATPSEDPENLPPSPPEILQEHKKPPIPPKPTKEKIEAIRTPKGKAEGEVATSSPDSGHFKPGLSELAHKPLVAEARAAIAEGKKWRKQEEAERKASMEAEARALSEQELTPNEEAKRALGLTGVNVREMAKTYNTKFAAKPPSTAKGKSPAASKPDHSEGGASQALDNSQAPHQGMTQKPPAAAQGPAPTSTGAPEEAGGPVPLASKDFTPEKQSLFEEFVHQINNFPTTQNPDKVQEDRVKQNANILSKNVNFCAKDMEPLEAAKYEGASIPGEDDGRVTFDVTLDREAPLFMPRKKKDGSPALDRDGEQIYDILYSAKQPDGSYAIDPARSFVAPDDIPAGTYSSVKKDIRDKCWAHHTSRGEDINKELAEDFSLKYVHRQAASIASSLPPAPPQNSVVSIQPPGINILQIKLKGANK